MSQNPSENPEFQAREWRTNVMQTFEEAAQRFDAQAWAMLMAPEEGGGRRRSKFLEARLDSIFESWIAEIARANADNIEQRERVKEATRKALHDLAENTSESLMRLAEQQNTERNPERTHALYLTFMEEWVAGLRAINPAEVREALRDRGFIVEILKQMQKPRDPDHRLNHDDYYVLSKFIESLRTGTNRNVANDHDPNRLFDQSLLGSLLIQMNQNELVELCEEFRTQGADRQETARILLLGAVEMGYKSPDIIAAVARQIHLDDGNFSRDLAMAEKAFRNRQAQMREPELQSILRPFEGNVALHNMTAKKYFGTSNVMILGGIAMGLNIFGRIIEKWSASTGKPISERVAAALSGVGDAATDPYVWLGGTAAAYAANSLSDGRLWAGFANAPAAVRREAQEKLEKEQRLWDAFHERPREFSQYFKENFPDLYASAIEQKNRNRMARPRQEDIPDLSSDELRVWNFRTQNQAKDFFADIAQTLIEDFNVGPASESGKTSVEEFFVELLRNPRPSRLQIPPETSPENQTT